MAKHKPIRAGLDAFDMEAEREGNSIRSMNENRPGVSRSRRQIKEHNKTTRGDFKQQARVVNRYVV